MRNLVRHVYFGDFCFVLVTASSKHKVVFVFCVGISVVVTPLAASVYPCTLVSPASATACTPLHTNCASLAGV